MEVRFSATDSTVWSSDCRLQNKFGAIHYDTRTSIRVTVD